MNDRELSDSLAVLRGLRPCESCKARRIMTVNREICGRVYKLKFACHACLGKGWYDPAENKTVPSAWQIHTQTYVDPDDA